jgi:N-methylhydantoinase A/oxoprolinase/acetone carboxylase beta subunit
VTDADLVLGRLDPSAPLAGGVALDLEAARSAVALLGSDLGLDLDEAAEGIARVADAEMAQAVRVMTVERGIDPRGLTLVAFGGAGPLHAAAIAEELGIGTVVAPIASGVLSALGLVVSERRRDLAESVLLAGEEIATARIAETVAALAERGRRELGAGDGEIRATYELRYRGQAFELPVEGAPEPVPARLRADFERAHRERYGYSDPDAELELVTVRVAVALPGAEPEPDEGAVAERRGSRPVRFGGEVHDATLLGPGAGPVEGPAVVDLPGSSLAVPPGWTARPGADAVVMER